MQRTGPDNGLLQSLRRVLATLADMAQSRIELASLEVGEAIERLVTSMIVAFVGVLLLAGALVAASALLVVAVDESRRLAVLGAMAVVYGIGGWVLLARLRASMRDAPSLLAGTLGELRNDSRVLRGEAERPR